MDFAGANSGPETVTSDDGLQFSSKHAEQLASQLKSASASQ
jgi:hypothetical protein